MIRRRTVWAMLGLVAVLSFAPFAAEQWVVPVTAGETAVWFFNNTTDAAVNILHLEFEQEVTISNFVALGGGMVPLGPLTGTSFDFAGTLVKYGTLQIDLPAGAVPALAQWLVMDETGNTFPAGAPFITSVNVLGRLFGIGIVAVREANPAALQAAFDKFFADNGEYLAGVSESLGMNLVDSLMPIIMAAPAEGIENFFNTIMGMLGVTSLTEVTDGAVDFSSLFALLGL